jgi:UDP-N-acetylmuramoyl-L-alanyl-D-glutamate--2,6-diaminopimelate ligase
MTSQARQAVPLGRLVAALDGARLVGPLDRTVTRIVADSRQAVPGCAFVALRGERADGHAFVERAIAGGAHVVVVDEAYATANPPSATGQVTTVVVAQTRRALSHIAAGFYEHPSRSLDVVGVTGTNGKTTTAHLIAALLESGGIASGRIGTLGAIFAGAMWPLDNTTPLALELHALLAEMRERGARAVVMEVSSHALALDRVADMTFALAVLTNVTRDHLDFHRSFEAYAATKRGFLWMAPHAVVGSDDAHGACWATQLRAQGRAPVTYGLEQGAAVRASALELSAAGSTFAVGDQPFRLQLPGRFNVRNALAALCVARRFGIDDRTCARALAAFEPVPGRMERISASGVDVFVDYAHTPDALEEVLQAAREATGGRLAVVFGCGGDRDRGKRPLMGRIAQALADRVMITSDNPRGEDPHAIMSESLAGIAQRSGVAIEVDRRVAIRRAIAEAAPGDLVVVAGKGHENYQLVGTSVHHFDDRDEVRAALAARQTAAAT